jgi:6,7-dimethyl-8-ribityllumazine synthase
MKNADKGLVVASVPTERGHGLRVGVVQARFNAAITNALTAACLQELHRQCAVTEHVTVPGALEVALALQVMAHRGEFDALIALGCVIRGETYHFELVANESGAAITRVSLDQKIPIANIILTVENETQAWARVEEKGRDGALVALEMAHLMKALL